MPQRVTFSLALILSVGIFLGISTPVLAQGMIIEPDVIIDWEPEPWMPYPQPLTLERQSIQIELDDQFAHIESTQVFRNNTWMDLEGTWVFPVPQGADIADFSLWMDGRELTSETMDAGTAASIYHQIVATMRDPGLLEYVGDGLIRAHIYPIPANGTKQIDMQYDWFIPIDTGLMRIDVPLKLDGYSIDMIGTLGITIDIDSPDTLGTIYSPTHDVRIDRHSPTSATVSIEKTSHRPQGDFILYVSRPDAMVGLNMLTHSTGDDEGFFMAMIAPEYEERSTEVIDKDFVCVLDTSGSMSGNKIEQAKDALDFIFRNLNEGDRFQLITFATDIYPYYDGWSNASSGNISDVRDYISGIDSGGSTNIYGALETALDLRPDSNRPMYVIFLTDGLPTVGQSTNTADIINNTNAINSEVNSRIFCFGVGDDVDYQFIDRLSREIGGYTANVAPNEDLEQPLSDFYAKIKSPVLTDIEIDIDGANIYDMLPATLPDLFLGSQLILTGRYSGSGSGSITVAGMVGDEMMEYDYAVMFAEDRGNDYIPRHWATRRVGYLLNQIRLYGENQEIVDEVTELAIRYGIITPYTSMLVVEDEMILPTPWDAGGGTFLMRNGGPQAAREMSEGLGGMEEEGTFDLDDSLAGTVAYAGDKTFYMNEDGYWVDSEYDEESMADPVRIDYLSDEYFDLLTDEPDIGEYLAVGDAIILVYEGTVYQIDPDE